jgi:hypothetical protein
MRLQRRVVAVVNGQAVSLPEQRRRIPVRALICFSLTGFEFRIFTKTRQFPKRFPENINAQTFRCLLSIHFYEKFTDAGLYLLESKVSITLTVRHK